MSKNFSMDFEMPFRKLTTRLSMKKRKTIKKQKLFFAVRKSFFAIIITSFFFNSEKFFLNVFFSIPIFWRLNESFGEGRIRKRNGESQFDVRILKKPRLENWNFSKKFSLPGKKDESFFLFLREIRRT